MTAAERQELAARIPWVIRRKLAVDCDGIKWGSVALRDLYAMGVGENVRPPRGIQGRSICKLQARWHFTALTKHIYISSGETVKAADFCWSHLLQHLYDGHEEEERLIAWLETQGIHTVYETVDAE